jgi:NADH-quinone oxidoreductase subunit H
MSAGLLGWMSPALLNWVVIPALKTAFVLAVVLTIVAYATLMERKVLAYIQARVGPNRAGPKAILQPLADGFKLMGKEDLVPDGAMRFLHFLAPLLIMVPALAIFALIPLGDSTTLFGLLKEPIPIYVTDLNVAVLFIVGFAGLGLYGVILGGWASNSKYSLLGALRSAAQIVSYEVPQALALVSVLVLAGSMSLVRIVEAQREMGVWFAFPGFLAFFIYFVCGVAETNRNPFDLPECESELVNGYFTEYSGVKFALFYMGEYANMVVVSSVATLFFLGGWLPPFPSLSIWQHLPSLPVFWFVAKILGFLFVYIWVRATFPRYRFDQLMGLMWKWMLPLALGNLMLLALVKVLVLS